MEETGVNLGQIGYEAYKDYTKTFADMPHWANLDNRIQHAWMVAGQFIQRAVIDHGGLSEDHTDCQLCRIIAAQ